MRARIVGCVCLLAAFCTFVISEVQAAKPSSQADQWGIALGIGWNKFTGSSANDPSEGIESSNLTGFSIGVAREHLVKPGMVVYSEINYAQKGSHYSFTELDYYGHPVITEADWNVSYLEAPTALRFFLGQKGRTPQPMPFLDLGFYVAYKISSSIEVSGVSVSVEGLEDLDLGGYFGGGVSLPMGANTLQASLHFKPGLYTIDAGNAKNSSFILTGALLF